MAYPLDTIINETREQTKLLVAIKKRLDESLPTLAEQNEAWEAVTSGAKAIAKLHEHTESLQTIENGIKEQFCPPR